MYIPSNVNNYRITSLSNDMVFLNEYFHNIESISDMGYCLLFFRLMKTPNKSSILTNPTTINYIKGIYGVKFIVLTGILTTYVFNIKIIIMLIMNYMIIIKLNYLIDH